MVVFDMIKTSERGAMRNSAEQLWDRLPLREDRSLNELNGVDQLRLASQQSNHEMNKSNPVLFTTRCGSVNGNGRERSFSSPILGVKNPRLFEALEPAIASFVLALKDLGLVTYTSCEGHIIGDEVHEAHVGFLYSANDSPEIWRAIDAAEQAGFFAFRTWLVDQEDRSYHPTVELYYPFSKIDLIDYHEALKAATHSFRRRVNGQFAVAADET
jgi:hypothetical protein